MPDLSVEHTASVTTLTARLGRCTLPIQRAHTPGSRGTAFWCDELVDSAPGHPVVKQYLVTAETLTRCDLGELLLRPALCDPPANAEVLLLPGFTDLWTPLDDLGVAVMPTAGLHAHAVRKGWRWTTDEVTDDVAAREADTAVIGTRPVPAFVLGHGVLDSAEPPGQRPQTVLSASVSRCRHGILRLTGDVPDGLKGAPVFTTLPRPGEPAVPRCLGVLLGTADHRVAPFDRIRRALRVLPPAPPPPRRRWGRGG